MMLAESRELMAICRRRLAASQETPSFLRISATNSSVSVESSRNPRSSLINCDRTSFRNFAAALRVNVTTRMLLTETFSFSAISLANSAVNENVLPVPALA